MEIIDISWPVTADMAEYGGRKIVTFSNFGNETKVTLINHTGTHVDGPKYFFKNAKSLDQFPLSKLIGRCIVLDLMHVSKKITAQDLENHTIKADSIILFKTKNSLLSYTTWEDNFIYFDASGAQYLAEKQVKSIGIDYLALETQPGFPSHKILLRQEILIIEGLRLENVEPKEYEIICLPIKLIGLDAAFARAILIKK